MMMMMMMMTMTNTTTTTTTMSRDRTSTMNRAHSSSWYDNKLFCAFRQRQIHREVAFGPQNVLHCTWFFEIKEKGNGHGEEFVTYVM